MLWIFFLLLVPIGTFLYLTCLKKNSDFYLVKRAGSLSFRILNTANKIKRPLHFFYFLVPVHSFPVIHFFKYRIAYSV